jgi:hypothetical protein
MKQLALLLVVATTALAADGRARSGRKHPGR